MSVRLAQIANAVHGDALADVGDSEASRWIYSCEITLPATSSTSIHVTCCLGADINLLVH